MRIELVFLPYLVWADPHILHDWIKLSKSMPQSVMKRERTTTFDVIYPVLIHSMDHWQKATNFPNWNHEWEEKLAADWSTFVLIRSSPRSFWFDVPQQCYFGLVTRQLCLWVIGEHSAAPSSVSSSNRLNTIAKCHPLFFPQSPMSEIRKLGCMEGF